MKIALLKSGLSHKGGLEKYTSRLAQAFSEEGDEVTLLTSQRRKQEGEPTFHPNIRTVCLGRQTWMGAKNRLDFDRWCQRWLRENPQQIVFGMDRNSHQTHYRVGEGIHKAYLERRRQQEGCLKRASFLFNPLHWINLRLERQTFADPLLQAVITNSHMVRQEVLHHYPIAPEKVHTVHNGVEWEEMASDFEASLSLPPSERHELLFIGHGWRRKGLAPLLDALAALPRGSFHLNVIGREKYPRRYLQQIERLGLQSEVSLQGTRGDVRRFMQRADTLVLPTLYDPFANVTVEALAMGLHVITTPHNGAKEILTEKTGTLVDGVEALASAMAAAPRKTPEHARGQRESVRHLDFSLQLAKIQEIVRAGRPLLHTRTA